METKNLVDAKLPTQIVYISENCRVSIGASSNFFENKEKDYPVKKKEKNIAVSRKLGRDRLK